MTFIQSVALLAGLAFVSSTVHGQTALGRQTALGSYTEQNATSDDVEILTQAAKNASAYSQDVDIKVCLIAIEGLETQTVAGTNYKFQVAGCPVESDDDLGACDDRNCDYSSYYIVIFSQPWTDTLEVTSIIPVEE
ncbi:Extracellular cystatin-like protease inhibitor [Phytophthora megakarya]|uniref:Extracellular cystatin-like protease inhibitor n=1 Tax=Phytophthora megakarya TaxID=4795 RepID=A0A225VE34_9STRA|nr:Extracellular cystatin-like protease inhibitor [Phytophthora megakarya]